MRAFFSVDIPDELTGAIADAVAAFEGVEGLNRVEPEATHVTLKFLGDVEDGELSAVLAAGERAVDRAGVEPFTCSVAGFGAFPSPEYITVIWAGVDEGAADLTRLHGALEAETTAIGFEPEDHEFTPHVTLARMNDGRGKGRVRTILREQHPEVGSFTVENIRLTESRLTSEGPVYRTVETFDL